MATTNQAATFAEAGVVLHAKLMAAVQVPSATGGSTTNVNSSGHITIAPTPLLTRVLRRTAIDFADVIVDGRCATGSRQVGSAAAVWVHHNAAARSAGGMNTSATSSPSSTGATSAAGGNTNANTNSSTTPSSSLSTAAATTTTASGGGITPLYYTEAALNECRHLLALYSFHCLLTASQLYNSNTSNTSLHVHAAADGRVHQLPTNASQWAPEVSFIIAETEASAEELLKICRSLAEACNVGVQVSTAIGSKTPASLIVRPASATGTSAATAVAGKSGEATDIGKKDDVKRKGAEWPCAASIIITTTHSFLNWSMTTLLNTGVEVAIAEDGAEAEANNDGAGRTRRVFPHIASIAVEEVGRATTSGTASAEKALQQWRDVHAAFNLAMPRQHPRYCNASHLLPHVLWICRGPVSRLPSSLRQLLSRRSRRYYQLQPSTYVPSAAASLMPQPPDGLSTPAESLGIRLVLSQNTADKDAQLRRIVTDRSGLYHRVLVLTHNKEVPHLNTLITSWGVSREYPSNSGNNTTTAATNATANSTSSSTNNAAGVNGGSVNNTGGNAGAGQMMTEASPNLVHSTRRMDSVVAQHQCHASYLNSCEAAERVVCSPRDGTSNSSSSSSSSTSTSSPVVVTLVAWDAFTALDVMDVDVIVQYYPPQKSLTEQEWAEFIQLLHTTVDGEREIELSLRQNRNNREDNIRAKLSQLMQSTTTGTDGTATSAAVPSATASSSTSPAPSRATPHRPLPVLVTLVVAADFTLTAHFLHQYLYSGATGALSAAATSTSLASIAPVPGKPGVQEPVGHPMPVLDISPKHPYFIPLVCGHNGGADWPAEATGSPPQARVSVPDPQRPSDAPVLLTHFDSGEAVTVRSVLAAKLAKEQRRTNGAISPARPLTTNATSPVMLLAQGNVSLGGNSASGGNVSKAGGSSTNNSVDSNLARLMAKGNMSASSSSGANGNASANARPQGVKDVVVGSAVEANTNTSSGGKGQGNGQKLNNNSSNGSGTKGGKGGASNNVNANNSSTTSSSAAAVGAGGNTSAGGQTDSSKSPAPAATSPSSKSGGSKRRQRSGKGSNNNNNANASGGNSSKKAAA
jgi:hypothetical protein